MYIWVYYWVYYVYYFKILGLKSFNIMKIKIQTKNIVN